MGGARHLHVKLTVDGKSYTQPIVVKQDPRVKTPALAMQQVYALTSAMYYGAADARIAATRLGAVRQQLTKLRTRDRRRRRSQRSNKKAAALEGTPPAAGGRSRRWRWWRSRRAAAAAPAVARAPDTCGA